MLGQRSSVLLTKIKTCYQSLVLIILVIQLCSHRVEQELVLWVLEDAGNHKWSKHSYVLSSPLEEKILVSTKFVGMTRTGELVYSWNSCVWFYNIERNTVKRVYIQGL
ncbi:unnamed protein product, partial [Brassica napus]